MKLKNRVLLNADCCAFFYNPNVWQPEGGPFGRSGIDNFVRFLGDAGVDTLCMNPTGQVAWFPSKKAEFIHRNYKRGDRSHFEANARCENIPEEKLESYFKSCTALHDLYVDLLDQGIDWLSETVNSCRTHGITPWVSIRMNDTHGGMYPDAAFGNSKLFRENPDVRLSKPCMIPGKSIERWAFDYENERARAHMFELMCECIHEYDFEGIELDFLRDPIIMKPVTTPEQIQIMTSFIWSIKREAAKKSAKTGRPFVVGLRSPGHLNLMRDMGLDIRELARLQIIDFAVFSNYYQTSWDMPHDKLKTALPEDFTIYGGIEGAPNWMKVTAKTDVKTNTFEDRNIGDRTTSYSAEIMRANAAGKLVLGADGVEFFNCFYAVDKHMKKRYMPEAIAHIDKLSYLRGKQKHYMFSTRYYRSTYTNTPYETIETLPQNIEPYRRWAWRLPMIKEPSNSNLTLVIQVVIERKEENPRLGVCLNGCYPTFAGEKTDRLLFPCGDYTHIDDANIAYNFTLDLSLVKDGYNVICVYNGNKPGNDNVTSRLNTIRVISLEVGII